MNEQMPHFIPLPLGITMVVFLSPQENNMLCYGDCRSDDHMKTPLRKKSTGM